MLLQYEVQKETSAIKTRGKIGPLLLQRDVQIGPVLLQY